jgi:hypothetical protein
MYVLSMDTKQKIQISLFILMSFVIFNVNMIYHDFKLQHHIFIGVSIEYIYFLYSLVLLFVFGIISLNIDI